MSKLSCLFLLLLTLLSSVSLASTRVDWPAVLGIPEGPSQTTGTTPNNPKGPLQTTFVPVAVSEKASYPSKTVTRVVWPKESSESSITTTTTSAPLAPTGAADRKAFADGQQGRCLYGVGAKVFHCDYLLSQYGFHCDNETLTCKHSSDRSTKPPDWITLSVMSGFIMGLMAFLGALISACHYTTKRIRTARRSNSQRQPSNQQSGVVAVETDASVDLPDYPVRRDPTLPPISPVPTLPPISPVTTLDGRDFTNTRTASPGLGTALLRPSGAIVQQANVQAALAMNRPGTELAASRPPSYETEAAQPRFAAAEAEATNLDEVPLRAARNVSPKPEETEDKDEEAKSEESSKPASERDFL